MYTENQFQMRSRNGGGIKIRKFCGLRIWILLSVPVKSGDRSQCFETRKLKRISMQQLNSPFLHPMKRPLHNRTEKSMASNFSKIFFHFISRSHTEFSRTSKGSAKFTKRAITIVEVFKEIGGCTPGIIHFWGPLCGALFSGCRKREMLHVAS